jgi:hypothetical protein
MSDLVTNGEVLLKVKSLGWFSTLLQKTHFSVNKHQPWAITNNGQGLSKRKKKSTSPFCQKRITLCFVSSKISSFYFLLQ